ncbi:hypothetical protein NGM37_02935, partial [Streptomyces sp. TRM76130]|nr:hypothetical protein [Streptomyces sp. TRM76130]
SHEFYWPEAHTELPGDPADDRLWAAVDEGDAAGLAELLGLGDDQRGSLDALLPALSSWHRERHERARLDTWRYRVDWAPLEERAATLTGTW